MEKLISSTTINDLRVVKTRRAIRYALIELMSEKELSAITISELSHRAQINRKTFYRHYNAIDEVITELENEILSEFSSTLKSSNSSCLDMGVVLRSINEMIERQRDFFLKMMSLNPEIFNTGKIKAMLRRAIEVSLHSVCEIDDPATLHAVSQFIVSGVLALYAEWFENGCCDDLDSIARVARRFTTDGLRAYVPDEKLSELNLK